MRNFFTQLFLIVLMVTLYNTSGFAQVLWPADNSTRDILPGSGQTLTLDFPGTTPANTVRRLRDNGVIALNYGDPGGTGIFQAETYRIGNAPAGVITVVGNQVRVTFQHEFVEDEYCYVTVTGDAIQFMDDSYFAGKSFNTTVGLSFDDAADWGFKVKDVTPPTLVTCTGSPTIHNGEYDVDVDANSVYLCFSEPVYWVGGSMPALNPGDVAFYHATNNNLDEFGGDVLYGTPAGISIYSSAPSGAEFSPSDVQWLDHQAVRIFVKDIPNGSGEKYAAIGGDVWPNDADIYLRFLGGLLEDKDGNVWDGCDGSPWDHNIGSTEYWFSTRDDAAIAVDIWNVLDNSTTAGHSPMWDNEDFVIQIAETGLTFVSGGSSITSSNVASLIHVTQNGATINYTVRQISDNGTTTTIRINPTSPYTQGATINVSVDGDEIWDADLVKVQAYSESFTAGDFSAPVVSTSIQNVLCTNFDIRATSTEAGQVYYAIVKEPVGTYFDNRAVTIADILSGTHAVTVGSNTYNYYFNNVEDGVTPLPSQTHGSWVVDYFNVSSALTAFEHVDDFTDPNNGDTYRIYYFALDPDAEGPNTTGLTTGGLVGRATGVTRLNVTLDDCLEPAHAWHFEGVVTTNDVLWDPCSDDGENIKKQGRWNFMVPVASGLHTDQLQFVNPNQTWEDVIKLEVSTDEGVSWEEVAIESIVYANDQVIVTPLNSYPSAGLAKVTLLSGTIEDPSGNAINTELSCVKRVESYQDPLIKTLTVETKDLQFPGAAEFNGLCGKVAKINGKITVEFNNPMYTPARDEVAAGGTAGVLLPISNDPNAYNYVGNYVKLREGDANGAEVTSNLATSIPLTFTLYNANGQIASGNEGIAKIVATPGANYKSENWYYVEVEPLLLDENRRELQWWDGVNYWDNNVFVDPHKQFATDSCTTNGYYTLAQVYSMSAPFPTTGSMNKYFMRFRTEDVVAPQLFFTFEKIVDNYPTTPNPSDRIYPYIAGVDEDVACVDYLGHLDGDHNGVPIGAIITEWSEMGFDDASYYTEVDPNGLRPYFTLKNSAGDVLDFDIVVLDIWPPTAPHPTYGDGVWFGFIPFTPLAEGQTYTMTFNPTYQAPGSSLAEGDVFIDDNGNPLVEDTFVSFTTCTTEVPCLTPTNLSIVGGTVNTGLRPTITLTFDRVVDDADVAGYRFGNPFFVLTDGVNTWQDWSSTLFTFNGNTITIPFEAFLDEGSSWDGGYTAPADSLVEDTTYTLTLLPGGFLDRNDETLGNCQAQFTFNTQDTTSPGIDHLSPDIDYVTVGNDVPNNLGQAADAINPRNPGKLIISFNEDVNLVNNKEIEVWHNGTSKRLTFLAQNGTWDAATDTWSIDLPADFLYYNGHYHVDVEQGFVVDPQGNEFNHMTGPVDGITTWTFATGIDEAIEYVSFEPGTEPSTETIDPNLAGDAYVTEGDSVRISEVSFTLSEKCAINNGALKVVIERSDDYFDMIQIPVSQFTSTDGKTWKAAISLLVAPGEVYYWTIPAGAFKATDNAADLNPEVTEDYEFQFIDNTQPTTTIWPVDGNVKVPFNAHGYVKFSESLIAKNGAASLVVTQSNIKNWIKVYKGVTPLPASDYVCEFIDLERTHIRVTFLDELAPSIDGVTANMMDETNYSITVNPMGDNGYTLQDIAGNSLIGGSSTFTTEDITPPNFYVRTCDMGPESVQLVFNSFQNTNPWGNGRNYPAEAGTIYYIVLPATATAPTADQLLNQTLSGVQTIAVPAGGANVTATWTLPAEIEDVYSYKVYAAMQDDETNVFVAPSFGGAWVTTDAIFVGAGDTNPATGAVGIADIRPAPNKSSVVRSAQFCFCDDDTPDFVSKEWNQNLNVPVGESFEITFDELVKFDSRVDLATGIGTGGNPLTDPNGEFGYEIRLREWNNNTAVDISVQRNADRDGIIITPDAPLAQETKYYIEIDRFAILDSLGSNCTDNDEELPEELPAIECDGCSLVGGNHFPGWVGRNDWWFQTNDNTPPVLTSVSPVGDCVSNTNNQIVFTFQEKNGMQIQALTGASANIYIYKAGEQPIPYEIIPASSGVITNPSTGVWKITYTTYHRYNSEESYEVEWNQNLFTDLAIPTPWNYTNASPDVTVNGGDAGAPWDMFTFTAKDNELPVIHWALVNTLYQDLDHSYVYQTPTENGQGVWDPNDPESIAPVDVNTCGDEMVPQQVAIYVWTNEDVDYVHNDADDEDPFFLDKINTPSGDVPVSLEVVHQGTTGTTLAGGVAVENHWWILRPNGGVDLDGSSQYQFGLNGAQLEDIPDNDCTPNVLPGQELFNFCTWNTDPAVATLTDGEDVIVNHTGDSCVAQGAYFDLCFDKVMVKTGNDGLEPPTTIPGYPWFTNENLPLLAEDLMDTDNGNYIDFRKVGGAAVVVSSVDILEPGKCYRLHLAESLDTSAFYTFTIQDSVLKDVVRVPNGNIFMGASWNFRVRNYLAPYVTMLTPYDGQTLVSPTAPLVVKFNRAVNPGDGRIIIRNNGPQGGVVANYLATDSHVDFDPHSSIVEIYHDQFADNTTYYVEITEGFAKGDDCMELPFAGSYEQGLIIDENNDSWNFSTGDNDGPVATIWPNQHPVYGNPNICVPPVTDLVLTFDENIQFATSDCAELVIYRTHGVNPPSSSVFGDVVERIPFTPSNFPQVRVSGGDAVNGLTSNVITVIPTNAFISGETYYVRIEGNGVDCATETNILEDLLGNDWYYSNEADAFPGIHENEWYFTIADDVAPIMTGTTPDRMDAIGSNQDGTGFTTDLTMTFDKAIAFGEGKIQIWEFISDPEGGIANQQEYLWKEFNVPADVENGKITLSEDALTVTIHDVTFLDGINWYYVIADAGTVTSDVPCVLANWGGIQNPDLWMFSTKADETAPTLTNSDVDSDALDETYEDPATVNFTLTFSEGISVANGTGLAEIKEDGVVVSTATITSANISGNVLTLNIADFDNALEDQKQYELVIGGDAIHDNATNSLTGTQNPFGQVPAGNENWFAGVTIPFETGDFTAPTAIGFNPNGVVDLENTFAITVTFDEPVQDGAGDLLVVNEATGETLVLDAANDEDTDPATVTFTVTLPEETAFHVLIGEGFVTDMLYNGTSLDPVRDNNPVANPATWTFATDDNTIPSLTGFETPGQDINNLEKSFDILLTYDDIITAVDITKAQLTLNGNPVIGITNAVLGPDAEQVTLTVSNVVDMSAYNLVLGAGFVEDNAINANESEAAQAGLFTVGDRTAPVLSSYAPTGILPSYIGVDVMVDFFDNSDLTVVAPITIEKDGEVVATWTPTLDANQAASFAPALWFGAYHVIIPAGAVVDVNGNEYAGSDWYFSIIDNTAPNCMTIVSPLDGATGVKKDANLEMEFCENVVGGTDPAKVVKVYKLDATGANELFNDYDATDMIVDGHSISIPLVGLEDYTSYGVLIDEGAILDEAGNAYEGIADPTFWNFTTGDNTPPTAWLVPAGGNNLTNTIIVEVHFSEPVIGAEALTLIDGGNAAPVWTVIDNKTYQVSVTADDLATVTFTVPVTITDASAQLNPLAAEVTGSYVVGDNTAPEVTVVGPEGDDAVNTLNQFDVQLVFTEEVTGVEAALAGSTGLVGVTTSDNITYTVTLAGDDETNINLVLDRTLVKDVSENTNELAEGVNITYTVGDHVAPTAVVTPENADGYTGGELIVTVTFDEDVIVPEGGIVVTGGQGAVSHEGNVYTVALTTDNDDDVVLNLTSLITDDSYNANALVPVSFNYGDLKAPQVSVVSPMATDTVNVFDVVITFDEMVTGVETGVSVSGHAPEMQLRTIVPGLAYEATLTGADGDSIVLAFANTIKDLAGNSLAPTSFLYTIADTKAPTVVANPSTGVKLENDNVVTLTFSEDVRNVETGVIVTGALTSNVTMVRDSVYEVSYTAADKATVYISVSNSVVDWKGNKIVPVQFMYKIDDNTAPTIVSVVPETADLAENTIKVVVTFSEPVWNAADGITVEGGNSFSIAGADGASVYTITMTGDDWDVLTMTIPTTIVDGAGNPNNLAAGGVYTYTIGDNTAPTVVVTGPVAPIPTSFTVGLEFSEPVQGVEAGVTGGTVTKVDDTHYTVAVTGAEKATVNVTLPATITDMYGNALAAQTLTYTIGDFTAPTATVVPGSADDAENTIPVVITFDEPVTGLQEGISVAGGTSTVVVNGQVATVTITAADNKTVVMTIANTIADLAGNKYAGSVHTYVIGDNTAPTVTVTGPAAPIPTTFTISLVFSEPVKNVESSVIGGTVTKLDNDRYTVTVTGAEQENVTVTLLPSITDYSGNALASKTLNYTIGDFTAPVATSVTPTGQLSDDTTFDLVGTFNENVFAGSGTMVVYKGTEAVASFTAAQVIISGKTVKAPVSLDQNTEYWVYVPAGFVVDAAGNPFAGVTVPNTWKFKTGNFAVIAPTEESIQFKVYPNPFSDKIFIDNADKLTRVVVSNIAGQTVIDIEYPEREVRTPNLVSGVYVVTLFTNDGIAKTERIVKR